MRENPLFRSGRMQLDYDHVETRGVLAGAYVDDDSPSMLRHLVFVGPGPRYEELRTGCRQPVDNVVDVYGHDQAELAGRPTCPTCAKKWEKIPEELRGSPAERFREPNGPTMLDRILDQVKYGKREVTIDAEEYSPEQVSRIIATAKARGLHVSGTKRWLLIRDLGKATGSAREPNGGYYVWVLGEHGEPMLEGPYGPHELGRAKALARIGATEGEHDRAVSKGVTPTAESFEIVRRYKAGSGERVI